MCSHVGSSTLKISLSFKSKHNVLGSLWFKPVRKKESLSVEAALPGWEMGASGSPRLLRSPGDPLPPGSLSGTPQDTGPGARLPCGVCSTRRREEKPGQPQDGAACGEGFPPAEGASGGHRRVALGKRGCDDSGSLSARAVASNTGSHPGPGSGRGSDVSTQQLRSRIPARRFRWNLNARRVTF